MASFHRGESSSSSRTPLKMSATDGVFGRLAVDDEEAHLSRRPSLVPGRGTVERAGRRIAGVSTSGSRSCGPLTGVGASSINEVLCSPFMTAISCLICVKFVWFRRNNSSNSESISPSHSSKTSAAVRGRSPRPTPPRAPAPAPLPLARRTPTADGGGALLDEDDEIVAELHAEIFSATRHAFLRHREPFAHRRGLA